MGKFFKNSAVLLIFTALSGLVLGHVNSQLLPEGCGSCHVGHGQPEEPMLPQAEENLCFACHGSDDRRSAMIADGKLSPAARLKDMEHEFKKLYHHPVEEGSGHSPSEKLPLFSGAKVSHAECVDCHNPHQEIQPGKPQILDVPGYSLTGQYLQKSLREYEVCLKCHTEMIGDNRTSRDISANFSLRSRSQHPVTAASTGSDMPSLESVFPPGSTMNCSDCHSGDDPDGPRGPHGSNHDHLLSGNYNTDIYSEESPYAYEFCYSCHNRSSILANESFPYHSQHIEGNPLKNIPGTSCFTCHASHGSPDNLHLINFNQKAVTGPTNIGRARYSTDGNGSGSCYLKCHGYNHNPAEY